MTTRHPLRILTATAFAALSLASCAVGPGAPDATLPPSASGAFVGAATPAVTAEAARDDWWRLYDDPTLDGLILQALAENNALEAAAANLRRVRAALGEARVGLFPSTVVGATGQYGRASAATVPGGNGGQPLDEGEQYDVGLDVAYEVDLFGRVSSSIRAAGADAEAAAAALDVVRVSVAAETASWVSSLVLVSWSCAYRPTALTTSRTPSGSMR